MTAAIIRHLEIQRFRGVRALSWSPHPKLNVVLGAADGGKSTILEAIALLFSAAPNYGLSEFDYHDRDLEMGFSIEAILSFSDIDVMRDEGFPTPPMQGWLDGKLTDLPDEAGAEAVLVCRLTGTADGDTLRGYRRWRRNSGAVQPRHAPPHRPGAPWRG
jgi:putative ATP-dependent endonuclease of the OLD family